MRRLLATLICVTCAPVPALGAEAAPVRPVPVVESAAFPPTNVEEADAPSPEVCLRLEDPAKGGVLDAGDQGTALLPGPPDEGTFLVRAEVEFLEANTSVEVRVVDAGGAQVNSVVLSSATSGRWSGILGEVKASQSSRMDVAVRRGSAIATAYRGGRDYVTTIPILSRAVVDAAGGGTAAFATTVVPADASPTAPSNRWPLATGTSRYTRNYSWPGSAPSFVVSGGPPSTCGEIHTLRNGSWVITSNWLCTNSSGYGTMGPWYISYSNGNQTDNPTYIQWPNGTTTTSTWSVIDTTRPTISFNTGVRFAGTATDAQWGSGFDRARTQVTIWYQDETTSLFWDQNGCLGTGVSCYHSAGPVPQVAYTDLPATGTVFQLNWWRYPWLTCEVGHRCSAYVKVNDIWSETTQKFTFQTGSN